MNSASWWSQPVAAEGSTASEGIRRQLGKPHLDPLEVLVRETAQNTCDAGLPGRPIEYGIRLRQLSGNQLNAWRDFLLPQPESSQLGLAEAMERGGSIMTIADRGTTGLGGPLRADQPPLEGERPDFVNFIRNVGERKNLSLGGGSYGFGKGILYNVSRCHVIVADSVCIFRGVRQRRLIAAALGDGYTHDGRRYTGRHWLGVREADGHTRPLLDAAAEEMAQRLGLPPFIEGTTGTTVAIVDPVLGASRGGDVPRTADDASTFLASTMLWNLWPRMLHDHPGRLLCTVRRDGFATDVPDPEKTIELVPFVEAYRNLSKPGAYRIPARKSPPTEIGRFSIVDAMAPLKSNPVVAAASPFTGAAHHCARMRQADLVVDYVAGESTNDEILQYGAVFRASPDADGCFAEAEPPTHDDWVTNGLSGTPLGVVRLANSFIRDELRDRASRARPPKPVGDVPLAALASELAGLLAADGGAAEAATRGSGAGPKGGGRHDVPRFVEGPALSVEDARVVIRAVVRFPEWKVSRTIVARPRVVVDGGTESPDDELPAPEVIGWRAADTDEQRAGDTIDIGRAAGRLWELRVMPPVDAVVRIDLDVLGADT